MCDVVWYWCSVVWCGAVRCDAMLYAGSVVINTMGVFVRCATMVLWCGAVRFVKLFNTV